MPQCRLSIHTFKKYVCHAKSCKKRVYKKKYAKNVAKKKLRTCCICCFSMSYWLTAFTKKKKKKHVSVSWYIHEVKVTIERAFSPPQNLYRAKPLRLQRWREKFFFASICTVLTPSALNGKNKKLPCEPPPPSTAGVRTARTSISALLCAQTSQKRPTTEAKETYYRGKRDLL